MDILIDSDDGINTQKAVCAAKHCGSSLGVYLQNKLLKQHDGGEGQSADISSFQTGTTGALNASNGHLLFMSPRATKVQRKKRAGWICA